MTYVAIIGGIITLFILAICCLFYPTNYTAAKWIIFVIFLIIAVMTVLEFLMHQEAVKMQAVYLKEACKMAKDRWYVFLYIPIFLAIAVAFTFILIYEFKSIWTHGHLEFDAEQHLYHQLKGFWPNFWTVLWVIQTIWGYSFIKEAFNFCVSGTAVLWYHAENSQDQQK